MLPTDALERMRQEQAAHEEAREAIIKESRAVQRAAKDAIFLLHEGKTDEAQRLLAQARTDKERIEKEHGEHLSSTGALEQALEEYAEAALLHAFLAEEDLPGPATLGVGRDAYLGALSDLTGELARTALFAAIDGDHETIKRAWQLASDAQRELAAFHLRGSLRKKYDAVKYNLQKIEQVLYDQSLRAKD